jgi:metal-responsive CopG/Arc/MetJ family transcriptional regulator
VRKAVKIAISLPDKLLRIAERERKVRRETRSEFFRRAVEALLRQEQERRDLDQYIQGYLAYPENEEEIEEARRLSKRVFAAESSSA